MDTDKSADESPPGTEEEGSDFKTFEPTGLGLLPFSVISNCQVFSIAHLQTRTSDVYNINVLPIYNSLDKQLATDFWFSRRQV
jgi:hypothetical protein